MTVATASLGWTPQLVRRIRNARYGERTEPRVGVCLHYDASGTDAGAMAWFADPKCRVSYQWLVLDDGNFAEVAPPDARAWHAGVCRPSDPARLGYADANSALLGIAVATDDRHDVTPLQVLTVAYLTRLMFDQHGWDVAETWRVVGHDTEAWPRGRKHDPTGLDPLNPILSVADVRQLLPLVRYGA